MEKRWRQGRWRNECIRSERQERMWLMKLVDKDKGNVESRKVEVE